MGCLGVISWLGCRYFYDITDRAEFKANPDYKGVCHVALAQEGHTRPGEVLFGTDSHTCNAGAFGQFATGIGNTDAAFVLGTGKLLIKVSSPDRHVHTSDFRVVVGESRHGSRCL